MIIIKIIKSIICITSVCFFVFSVGGSDEFHSSDEFQFNCMEGEQEENNFSKSTFVTKPLDAGITRC